MKPNGAEDNPRREVRFAVVMYGGVSLAIYINGVAQELLNMVRATATLPEGEKLSGSELVYQRIARHVDRLNGLDDPNNPDIIHTRFIVDVISGTSAGGINGVFLAKALARNQKMDGLKKLWLQEGDLGKLLNDPRSMRDLRSTGIKRQSPPQSLLNSRRMYRKLLEALAEMGKKGETSDPSPLVGELDLFVTTTDIEGVPLPISLADDVVYERRYKNVFHFRYAPDPRSIPERVEDLGRDDFKKDNDPFLAFAARCTSSFPFAFEAMQLADIEDILDYYERYADNDPKEAPEWDHFFKDYLRLGLYDIDKKARHEKTTGLSGDGTTNPQKADNALARLRERFRTRSFGDGGYLDNKPFSHATSMLMRRHSVAMVARKLIYVEPTPDHPELAPSRPPPRPDFAENVRAAAMDLPRQETIREDLERVFERNGVLERIGTFAKNVDEDLALVSPPKPMDPTAFRTADLKDMMSIYKVSYGAYHRLKVQEITKLLTDLIASALGHDPTSNAASAIGELVRQWRRRNYGELKANQRPKTENEFLVEFDIRYCLRRLFFLNRRTSQLAQLEKPGLLAISAEGLLHAWLDQLEASLQARSRGDVTSAPIDVDFDKVQNLRKWVKPPPEAGAARNPDDKPPPDWVHAFCTELNRIKKVVLAPALIKARLTEESFLHPKSAAAQGLRAETHKLNLPWEEMVPLLSENEKVKHDKINVLFEQRGAAFESVAAVLRNTLSDRAFAKFKIAQPGDIDPTDGAVAARLCLDHYDRNFVLYDLVTFPVQYGTGAGEANVVDVYRVSPEDAAALMEERPGASGATKLAGRALMSFGAFLDEPWRRNDMLWGRLDGAERLVSILTDKVDDAIREQLIREAHLGIINQEIQEGNADTVCRLLSHALAHAEPQEPCGQKLGDLVREVLAQNASRLNHAQQTALTTPQSLDRQLPPRRALEYISRSTNITGDMLSGLADQYQSNRGRTVSKWIAGVGSTLWNVIAVAVPQSLGNLFFRHLLGLFYFFAFALIFVGIFLNNSVKFAGWQLLGLLALIQLVVAGVGAFISGNRWFMKLVVGAIVSPLLALLILGLMHVSVWWRGFEFNQRAEFVLAGVAAIAVVVFFILLPAVVRAISNLWSRARQQFES
jgi:patatin-related protein